MPPASPQHLSGYQARDFDVVDYQMYELAGTGLSFRGPPPPRGDYFACIGAAQTLGCFVQQPFAAQLAARLGMAALNLGYGGAGPEFFLKNRRLHDYLNNARFVIVQAMSGRSQSNSLFDSAGLEYLRRRSDERRLGANEAYDALLEGPLGSRLRRLGRPGAMLRRLGRRLRPAAVRRAQERTRAVIEETRRGWLASHADLCARIRVPRLLFWFSKRSPDYPESLESVERLFGEFPQLINAAMIRQAAATCDGYVECISSRGSPQPLFSRFTGRPVSVDPSRDRPDLRERRPWTHNAYYPSPEMHDDAAAALEGACRRLLEGRLRSAS